MKPVLSLGEIIRGVLCLVKYTAIRSKEDAGDARIELESFIILI